MPLTEPVKISPLFAQSFPSPCCMELCHMPTEYENIELEKKERRQNFFFRKEKDYVEKVTLVHIVV